MKRIILLLLLTISLLSCTTKKEQKNNATSDENPSFTKELTIAFGSCNNQRKKNTLYSSILAHKPATWIWGGDIIYSDTDNPKELAKNYNKLKQDSAYSYFKNHTKIIATWDDHDYGVNDGGTENPIKQEAQQIYLDFLDAPKEDARRKHEGVYYSETIKQGKHQVKIIVLDTRYFRTALRKDPSGKKRYLTTNTGTMLGDVQWQWLSNELNNDIADFTIIVSSIQFLSNKHGFESWGNMPHEVKKLKTLLTNSNVKNTIIISGDRHIAEFSKTTVNGKALVDFTSSGLTHAYTKFHGEENPYRTGKVIHQKNFGLLYFDFTKNQVLFEIRGEDDVLLEQYMQQY